MVRRSAAALLRSAVDFCGKQGKKIIITSKQVESNQGSAG